MKIGDTVRISNPKRAAVVGSILELTTPAQLLSLPSHAFDEFKTRSVRAILDAWDVKQVALLSYRWHHRKGAKDVSFFALAIGDQWFDLKHEPISIEPFATEGCQR